MKVNLDFSLKHKSLVNSKWPQLHWMKWCLWTSFISIFQNLSFHNMSYLMCTIPCGTRNSIYQHLLLESRKGSRKAENTLIFVKQLYSLCMHCCHFSIPFLLGFVVMCMPVSHDMTSWVKNVRRMASVSSCNEYIHFTMHTVCLVN